MTDAQLQDLVEQVSLDCFHRPFNHQARWNPRLRTSGGRYHLQSHHLDFNPKILRDYGQAELLGIIKHELCHYHLHLLGRGYQHKDQDFKYWLKAVGGTRYAPHFANQGKIHTYTCQDCGHIYRRKRRIDTKRFVCGRCQGRLNYQGQKL